MATKKPMKKPVKRVRRFQEGGEAALKAEGLAASNKTPMGFFERLRMGNIDQEGSEAYNRLGAGRGRMERDAASELAANQMVDNMNASRSARGSYAPEQLDAEAGDTARMSEMMERGRKAGMEVDSAERMQGYKPLAAAQNAAILAGKVRPAASRPLASQLPAKPAAAASKPAAPAVSKGSQSDDALSRRISDAAKRSGKETSNLGVADRAALLAAQYETMGKGKIDRKNAAGASAKSTTDDIDETKLSLSDRMKRSRERSKSGSGPTDKRSVNERMRETFGMKKGGAVKKMASGGMTSSASKRADGIATKGKTRGKIC